MADEEQVQVRPPIRRITVLDKTYHQTGDSDPKLIDNSYNRTITSDDQKYERELKATEEWTPLELGWAAEWDGISSFHIRNVEGKFLQRLPSPTQKAAMALQILELGDGSEGGLCWTIAPGESMRGIPSDLKKLKIRSQSGITKFVLTIIPG